MAWPGLGGTDSIQGAATAGASGGGTGSLVLPWCLGRHMALGWSSTNLPFPFAQGHQMALLQMAVVPLSLATGLSCYRTSSQRSISAPPPPVRWGGLLGQSPAGKVGDGGKGKGPVPGHATAAVWAIGRGGRGHFGACAGFGTELGAALPGKQRVSGTGTAPH